MAKKPKSKEKKESVGSVGKEKSDKKEKKEKTEKKNEKKPDDKSLKEKKDKKGKKDGKQGATPQEAPEGEIVPPPTESSAVSLDSKTGLPKKKKNLRADSIRYLNTPLEWDPEELKNAELISNGFTCSIVLVMEESPALSDYTVLLHQAVNTGVRKRFASISAQRIAHKVRKFMTTSEMREPGMDDESYLKRMDIWAQALKHTLLMYKISALAAMRVMAKAGELTGVRSKDFLSDVPPLAFSSLDSFPPNSLLSTANEDLITIKERSGSHGSTKQKRKKSKGSEQSSRKRDGSTHSKDSKGSVSKKKSKNKRMSATDGRDKDRKDSKGSTRSKSGRRSKGSIDSKSGATKKDSGRKKRYSLPLPSLDGMDTYKSKTTLLKKRGELDIPIVEYVEDTPVNGPQSYFLLEGFYNPLILEELRAIGVKVDGVLLLTAGTLTKRNFSVLDIEENLTGSYRPQNILPAYAQHMDKNLPSEEKTGSRSNVNTFWSDLTGLINSQPADSFIHDIALINCPIPSLEKPPTTDQQKALYGAHIFDEVVKRIYEMLVLIDWYNMYQVSVQPKPILPPRIKNPMKVYDNLLTQLPSECITVPIILDCLVEQVVADVGEFWEDSSAEFSEDQRDNKSPPAPRNPENIKWGLRGQTPQPAEPTKAPPRAKFPVPLYIKSNDYASMRSCHLNEQFSIQIAASHISGELHAIQNLIRRPEFNRGKYLKLLANLNHFMYFLPPNLVEFDDMFFVLHLLMAAGIELHLQKVADEEAQREIAEKERAKQLLDEENAEAGSTGFQEPISLTALDTDELLESLKVQINKIIPPDGVEEPETDVKVKSTRLAADHNYLAVENKKDFKFIMAPNSMAEFRVQTLPQGNKPVPEPEPEPERYLQEDDGEGYEADVSRNNTAVNTVLKHSIRRSGDVDTLNQVHGSVVAAAQAINTVGEELGNNPDYLIDDESYENEQKRRNSAARRSSNYLTALFLESRPHHGNTPTPPNTACADEDEYEGAAGDGLPVCSPKDNAKRFVACEEEWFNNINDFSAIQTLLECPALLGISESGALDLSNWVERYLLCDGLTKAAGESVILGHLKDWNFVEEFVPLQMIQALNHATKEYLCMEKMYCPFYDTILFIFNNPAPLSLQAESTFCSQLKTMPGLQDFLEYTINEDGVLGWLLNFEKVKSAEIVDSFSVTTLMRLVPEEQWMLIPSIKWALLQKQKEQEYMEKQARLAREYAGEDEEDDFEYEEEEEDEDEEFGKLKRKQARKSKDSSSSEGKKSKKIKKEEKRKSKSKDKEGKKKKKKKSEAEEVVEKPESPAEAEPEAKNEEKAEKKKKKKDKKDKKRKSRDSKEKEEEKEKDKSVKSDDDANEKKKKEKKEKKEKKAKKEKKSKKSLPSTELPSSGAAELQTALANAKDSPPAFLQETPSFNFTDAIKASMYTSSSDSSKKTPLEAFEPRFECYDLGKRIINIASSTHHLFPLDGTLITYQLSTIDPDSSLQQLTVSKNGHSTYFYSYYIPHDDLDLSTESYVVTPYFHMIHSNGTIFAFQDNRATEEAPNMKLIMKQDNPQPTGVFDFEHVVFENDIWKDRPMRASFTRRKSSGKAASTGLGSGNAMSPVLDEEEEEEEHGGEDEEEMEEVVPLEKQASIPSSKSAKQDKKGKGHKHEKKGKTEEKEEKKHEKKEKAKEKKGKKKKGKPDREEPVEVKQEEVVVAPVTPEPEQEEDEEEEALEGEYEYSSGENTEAEEGEVRISLPVEDKRSKDSLTHLPKRYDYQFPWEGAAEKLTPLTHSFRVTLPSGLFFQVEDAKGPPLRREVKQCYLAKSSACSINESCRYYTMNGSVIRFMLNKSIQILNARGVTTTIREISADATRTPENLFDVFSNAENVNIFNGDVILPTGEYWRYVNGHRTPHEPFYLFTSGMMPNGEVFRRRQDGVVYLHRFDGTVITHYPDGTRFTTRMVILKDDVEEFEDWVFVGLKYMVEHPSFATVLFNTLSSNVHIKLPEGDWLRVLSDGSIKVGTKDDYKLDVDKYRAVLSSAPCVTSGSSANAIPNLVAVKLYHSHQLFIPPVVTKKKRGALESVKASIARLNAAEEIEIEIENIEQETESEPPKPEPKPVTPEPEPEPAPVVLPTKVKKGKGPKPKKGKDKNKKKTPPKVDDPPELEQDLRVLSNHAKTGFSLPLEREDRNKSWSLDESQTSPLKPPSPKPPSPKPVSPVKSREEIVADAHAKKQSEIEDFLLFHDMFTFCKAIDSYDNRFAMDIFGQTVVDKSEAYERKMSTTQPEDIIQALSTNFQLPRKFVSGLLKATSSEDLSNQARRIKSLKKAELGACNPVPKTKLFVVKRDLSGFQYLKRKEVQKIVKTSKDSRESMITVDPVPRHTSRSLITIMDPISTLDSPHGTWKAKYREPVFRPAFLSSKNLRRAKKEDLRWFGFIVVSAHIHRPRFLLSPKEKYLLERGPRPKKASVRFDEIMGEDFGEEEEGESPEAEAAEEISVPEIQEQAEAVAPEEDVQSVKKDTGKKGKRSKDKDKDAKSKKGATKTKKPKGGRDGEAGELKEKKTRSARDADTGDGGEKEKKSKKRKKSITGAGDEKTAAGKSLTKIRSKSNARARRSRRSIAAEQATDRIPEPEIIEPEPIPVVVDPEYGDYDAEIPDIEGLYGVEEEEEHAIRAQYHPDIMPTRKAIVVRTILEIPKIDDKMQRALLGASLSYSQTFDNYSQLYAGYEVRDPRTEAEKDKQKIVKQQFIEKNLDNVHLFEQKPGNILNFHL